MLYANNKGADQPAHPRNLISAFVFLRSLISAFVVRCLDSNIPLVYISEISSFCLASGLHRPVVLQHHLEIIIDDQLESVGSSDATLSIIIGYSFFCFSMHV